MTAIVGTNIKETYILKYLRELLGAELEGVYICGGYASFLLGLTKAYDDIDLYFIDQAKFDTVVSLLNERSDVSKWDETSGTTLFGCSIPGVGTEKIQCIRKFGSIEKVLGSFDFNICQVGILHMGDPNPNADSYAHWGIRYSLDVHDRTIKAKKIRHPIKALQRLVKYSNRLINEHRVPLETYQAILERWRNMSDISREKDIEFAELKEYDLDLS